jgi:hypothetical protein
MRKVGYTSQEPVGLDGLLLGVEGVGGEEVEAFAELREEGQVS